MVHPRDRLREYFADVLPIHIEDDEDIFVSGIVDSLFAVHLVMYIEAEFGIVAEPTDLEIANFCSISALTRFVERKLFKSSSIVPERLGDQ